MKMKKKICLLFILCLSCMLFNACGGQTAQSGDGGNKTEQENKTGTGSFSGEGAWKGKEGIIILLEADGTGSFLGEMNDQGDAAGAGLPGVIKTEASWEEDEDTVTVTSADGTFILKKVKSGTEETLELNNFVYTRLNENERKEYQEKAAAAVDPRKAQQTAQADSRNEEILLEEPLQIIDSENVTIHITRFFREVANEGTEYEFISAGFEIEVENKTDKYEISVTPRDCSLSDRRVIDFVSWNSGGSVAPGKIAAMKFIRSNSEDFEDLNALYELEGNLDLNYVYDRHSNMDLGGKVPFSIPDAIKDKSIAQEAGENRSAYKDVFKAVSANIWFYNGGGDTSLNYIAFKENKASLNQVYFDGNGFHKNDAEECPYIISDEKITVSAKDGEIAIPYRLSGEEIVLGEGQYFSPDQVEEGLQGYWTCTTYSDFTGKNNTYYLFVDHGTLKSENAAEAVDGTDGEYYYYGPYEGTYTLGTGGFITEMRHGGDWFFNIIDGKPTILHYDTVCTPADGFPGRDGYYF